jgi:hypothetical protein
MNQIPMLEKFAVQSLVEHNGELIFSKEKFAELIVRECANIVNSLEQYEGQGDCSTAEYIKERFGVG